MTEIANNSSTANLPFNDSGQIVVTNRNAGTLSVIDVETDTVAFEIPLPRAENEPLPEPMYLVYLSETDEITVGDRANDRLVVYNRSDYSLNTLVPLGEGVFHSWADPDEEQLWTTNDIDNTITVVELPSKQAIATIPLADDLIAAGGKVHDVFLDPVTDHAYVSVLNVEGDGDIVVKYSTETFEEVDRALVGDLPHLSATASNDVLYVASESSDLVSILDRDTLDIVDEITVPGAHGVVGTFDRETYDFFYTTNLPGGGAGGLLTLDTQTNQLVGEAVDTPFPIPHNLFLSPDSSKLYITHSGATANQVSVYDIASDGIPSLLDTVEVGLNPYGIVSVAPSTDPEGGLITQILLGTEAGETIAGDSNNTEIFGYGGDDILRGEGTRVSGNSDGGDDIIHGGDGNDRIGGKGGNDELYGDEGDDSIWGDDGDDLIRGGAGNDILIGDNFSGGVGADTFILAAGEGTDTIIDFEVGIDLIALADLTVSDLSINSIGNDTEISFNGEILAILSNVNTAALTAGESIVAL